MKKLCDTAHLGDQNLMTQSPNHMHFINNNEKEIAIQQKQYFTLPISRTAKHTVD